MSVYDMCCAVIIVYKDNDHVQSEKKDSRSEWGGE
jgi:hypothetical protein